MDNPLLLPGWRKALEEMRRYCPPLLELKEVVLMEDAVRALHARLEEKDQREAALVEFVRQTRALIPKGACSQQVTATGVLEARANALLADLHAEAAKRDEQLKAEGAAEAKEKIAALEAENRRARVQVPLWRGVAASMVVRASKIKCQFGGEHSVADCRCDPYQIGDSIVTMHDEIERAEAARREAEE